LYEVEKMKKLVEKAHSEKMADVLGVQSTAISAMSNYLSSHGFVQLMPVMLSPITDPLCHSVREAEIEYEGQRLQLTKSMILHKQIAISSPHMDRIFIVSPNVRLERPECGSKGRYLIEFSQVDIEMKGAKKEEFMRLLEGMVVEVIREVKEKRGKELECLGRKLAVPPSHFPVYESKQWRDKLGEDFEAKLSARETSPFWIMDHAREFYDREDPMRPGYYHNYDLFYPEGFGEGLSGAERDWEYSVLERKIRERGQQPSQFGAYMQMAKEGLLKPSAGGGIGVERLVRYLCGLPHIGEVGPFAKVPGERFMA